MTDETPEATTCSCRVKEGKPRWGKWLDGDAIPITITYCRQHGASTVERDTLKSKCNVLLTETAAQGEQIRELREALEKITHPEGAYSRDEAEYRKNVIEECITIATEALAKAPVDSEEGEKNVDNEE